MWYLHCGKCYEQAYAVFTISNGEAVVFISKNNVQCSVKLAFSYKKDHCALTPRSKLKEK
jgi:hypothetical protein